MSRYYEPSLTSVRGPGGLAVGGTAHRVLLALRAGQMSRAVLEQRMCASISQSLLDLQRRGYIAPAQGSDYAITPAGRDVVSPTGAMARSKTLITYCQL